MHADIHEHEVQYQVRKVDLTSPIQSATNIRYTRYHQLVTKPSSFGRLQTYCRVERGSVGIMFRSPNVLKMA